ncbi:MAG: CooT family nickel-binding protein [Proteobacteria bacterium]|nr:CooT family nickel-binding protein [Pseudomonadota bacterium]
MCESSVFIKKGNTESLIMENVAAILPQKGGRFLLRGLLGESMEVKGQIDEINLMAHKIIIKSPE